LEGKFEPCEFKEFLLYEIREYFGLDGDPFTQVPRNVSSVVDLLEDRGISWSLYQEDMPYSGYQGFSWVNQKTGANDYVRKHK